MGAPARYNPIPGGDSNILGRRTTWLKVGPFDTRLRSGEDWEMSIAWRSTDRRHGCAAPLIAKRVHPSNMSLDIAEIVRATKLIEAMHNTQADWGRLHRWLAERYLRSGQRGAALGELAKAATRGQLRGVTSDLTAILRRRLGHTVSKRAGDAASAADAWTAMATAWLREFEGCVQ